MNFKNQSFKNHKRLSILQFSTEGKNSFDYISGVKAMNEKKVIVTEKSEAGSVNNIIVKNLSDKYLFFSDGDILLGAKQNRVVNISMLIAPNSETNVTVSCIERGRWSRVSSSFTPSDFIIPRSIRAHKHRSLSENLLKHNQFYANQHDVWNRVNDFHFRAGFNNSPTSDLHSGLDAVKESFEEYLNNFKPDQEANGLAVFFDDNLVSIDVFNRDDIYRDYFPRLIHSSATETYYLHEKQINLTEALAIEKVNQLLSKLDTQKYVEKANPGVGTLKNFTDETISGFMLNYENHLIHLAILNLLEGKKQVNHEDFSV